MRQDQHAAPRDWAARLWCSKVPLSAVMEIMGWADASVAKRYMHVPSEFLAAIADQVGGLVWADPDDDDPPTGVLAPTG